MKSKAGLKKVTKTVRSKHGTVRRSYWVSAKQAVGKLTHRLAAVGKQHGGKALTALALVGAATLANRHRDKVSSFAKSADSWRRHSGASLADKLVNNVGNKIVEHVAGRIGRSMAERAVGKLGKRGRKFKEIAGIAGEVIGETVGGHVTEKGIKAAGQRAASRLRKKRLLG